MNVDQNRNFKFVYQTNDVIFNILITGFHFSLVYEYDAKRVVKTIKRLLKMENKNEVKTGSLGNKTVELFPLHCFKLLLGGGGGSGSSLFWKTLEPELEPYQNDMTLNPDFSVFDTSQLKLGLSKLMSFFIHPFLSFTTLLCKLNRHKI